MLVQKILSELLSLLKVSNTSLVSLFFIPWYLIQISFTDDVIGELLCCLRIQSFGVYISLLKSSWSFSVTSVHALETTLQTVEMSFEKCLTVIDISSQKLSMSPEIFDGEGDNRIAIFKLQDGSLKIVCDGQNNALTVSTF